MTEKLIEVRITDGPWKKVEPSATIGDLVKSMNLFKCRGHSELANYTEFWENFKPSGFNRGQFKFLEGYLGYLFIKGNTIYVGDNYLLIKGQLRKDGHKNQWAIRMGEDSLHSYMITPFEICAHFDYLTDPTASISMIFGGDL